MTTTTRPVLVTLRDTTDGTEHTCKHDGDFGGDWVGFNDFNWRYGNFSCDCNRAIFFTGDVCEFPCGEERYLVVKIVDPTDPDTVLYSELGGRD